MNLSLSFLFFFNDTATTEIYTLSLHDALPISSFRGKGIGSSLVRHLQHFAVSHGIGPIYLWIPGSTRLRSEEHTSELQSRSDLVCRLLLEKKKKKKI